MNRIFCVEDDENIRELIEYTLSNVGYDVKGFCSANEFYEEIKTVSPTLILLDIMLPDSDGLTILSNIRQNESLRDIPVIMLTAKSGQMDKIKGLNLGADDYITKPFDIMELMARINAVIRRIPKKEKSGKYTFKEITIDTNSRKVTANGKEITLTYKEFELLSALVINKGIVLSRESLMLKVWDTDFEGESRTVDVHIRSLRQKLGEYGEYICTIRNVGYKVG